MAALDDYNGKEKAAMLLISLGPEKSAEIFKYLKEDEILTLTLVDTGTHADLFNL